MAYGSSDAGFEKAEEIDNLIREIKMWDSVYLIKPNVFLSKEKLREFHKKIWEKLEDINIMM